MTIMSFRLDELAATLQGLHQTGVPLVAASDGTLRASGFSDDPGLYLFVPIIARLLNLDAYSAYRLFVILLVSIGAITGVLGFFALTKERLPRAYTLAIAGVLVWGSLRIADVYSVAFAVPFACVPWLLAAMRRPWGGRHAGVMLATIGGISYTAHLLRSHAATSLVLFTTLLILQRLSRPARIRALAALVLGVALVASSFAGLTAYRDAYLSRAVPNHEPTPIGHPFWHSVYLGLAYLPNPYVSAWDDRVAAAKAAELAPEAPYLSPAYENALMAEYLRVIGGDPLFALRTYGAKLAVVIPRVFVLIGLGWFALSRRRPPRFVLVAFLLAIAFEALPSLVTLPAHRYMLGLYTWSAMFGIVCVMEVHDPPAFEAHTRTARETSEEPRA